MNSVSRRTAGKIPPPSNLTDELGPIASNGLGGLSPDVDWIRGPVALGSAIVGMEALVGNWRTDLRGPFRWETPAIHCVACLEGGPHDAWEVYRPARHYRKIASDFLAISGDIGVLEFSRRWGLIRLNRLEPDRTPRSEAGWANAMRRLARSSFEHDRQPDLVDHVLEWVDRARHAYEAAYSLDAEERGLGHREVVAVIRTMETEFAPTSLAVLLVPTSLLHVIYFALLCLYDGASRLMCAEWLAAGCTAELPAHIGRGRPRLYCSDRCAWRARNRRRALVSRSPKKDAQVLPAPRKGPV